MDNEKPKITCPTFQKQESITREIANHISKINNIKEKIELAKELLTDIRVLLSCPDYKQQNFECRNCRTVADLRREDAEIIIQIRETVLEK